MPALDVCYEGGQHRNRGLCSVPRAFRWIGFNNEMLVGRELQDLQIRAFLRRKQSKSGQVNSNDGDDGDDEEWTELAPTLSGERVANAIERTIFALAESAPDDLGDGSNLIHALVETDDDDSVRLEYPGNGHELCIVMDDNNFSHPGEDDVKGKLQVSISAAMAGSESQYLPDAYKPLYKDMSLRNPRYEKFRERRQPQD